MSSQDLEPPRVGLMSLPKDILHRVVLNVEQQDKAVRTSGISLASSPASPAARAGTSTKLPGGKWAFEYGHGVGSLSLVNKALRRLALPLLIQTVKASQLAKPLFEFRTIEPALLAGITSLDLRGAEADDFAAAALALEALPSLRKIKARSNVLEAIEAGDCDEHGQVVPDMVERRELALKTFRAAANNISHMEFDGILTYGAPLQLASIAKFAALPTLRSLVLSAEYQVFISSRATALADILQQIEGLEVLSIDSGTRQFFEDASASAAWQGTQLTTLRKLTLRADEAKVFAFAAHLAPQLESLEVSLSPYIVVDSAKERVSIPSLRHLRLTGSSLCGLAITHVDLSSLSSLAIHIDSSPTASVASTDLLPDRLVFPVDLQLNLSVHSLLLLDDYDALEVRLVASGVELEYDASIAPLAPYSPRSDSSVREPAGETSAVRYAAVVDTLEWAEQRVQRLYAEGDVEGMQELAEAVKKVAERKMLERL